MNGFCTIHHTDLFANQILCNELVDLYFEIMHDKEHAIFHRPSFTRSQREGTAPLMIVSAMMALGSRFSSNPCFDGIDPWDRGRPWFDYSRHLFDHRTVNISLEMLQACTLLCKLAFAHGDSTSELLYGALIIRMLQLLDYPRRLSSDRLQRETEIRIFWTTWCMDMWTSVGTMLPRQLYPESTYPRPMEETLYESLVPGMAVNGTPFESPQVTLRTRDCGIWAQMVPLTEIMCQVKEVQDKSVNGHRTRLQSLGDVQMIANRLDSWVLRLPIQLQNTPENMMRYAEVGHGRTFVALHLGYLHHAQNLYYQFLHEGTESKAEQTLIYTYAKRCKQHAAELSNLMWLANNTQGCECLWVVTGHLLAIASSVHLHTLLFDTNEALIEESKTMLRQNFKLMIRLRRYWPGVDLSMSRLRAFHRACQRSMHTSFDMDHWMLHFLQRYHKPVDDKDDMLPLFRHDSQSDTASVVDFGSEPDTMWGATNNNWQQGPGQAPTGSEILQTFL